MWANEAGEFSHSEPVGAEGFDGFYLFARFQKLFGFLICHVGLSRSNVEVILGVLYIQGCKDCQLQRAGQTSPEWRPCAAYNKSLNVNQ